MTGVSALVGYKLTRRLQAIARADDIDNRANGGGMYFNPADAKETTVFGPELNETGVACAGGLILTRCCRSAPEPMNCNTVRVAQNDARGKGHIWRV